MTEYKTINIMNILVWKGYGNIEVFSAESVKDVEKIIELVTDIFEYWKDEETSRKLFTLVEKVKEYSAEVNDSELGLAKRLRNSLYKFLYNRNLTQSYDVDEFEYFFFHEVKKID